MDGQAAERCTKTWIASILLPYLFVESGAPVQKGFYMGRRLHNVAV